MKISNSNNNSFSTGLNLGSVFQFVKRGSSAFLNTFTSIFSLNRETFSHHDSRTELEYVRVKAIDEKQQRLNKFKS